MIFFSENRIWCFMQIVSIGDSFNEMSKSVFWEKYEKYSCPPPMGMGTLISVWITLESALELAFVGVGVTFSCLHYILWTSGWVLTKFSWIYNMDIPKNRLDFGDLDLIFKVTAEEKLKIRGRETYVFSKNTVTSSICHLLKILPSVLSI